MSSPFYKLNLGHKKGVMTKSLEKVLSRYRFFNSRYRFKYQFFGLLFKTFFKNCCFYTNNSNYSSLTNRRDVVAINFLRIFHPNFAPPRLFQAPRFLKLVSAIFYQIFIFLQNDSHLKTMKNVFYFI